MMTKYGSTIGSIVLTIILVGFFAGIGYGSAVSQGPVVRFTIAIPQEYNATGISYTCEYNWFTVSWEHTKSLPEVLADPIIPLTPNAKFGGTARVGSEITFHFKYYKDVSDGATAGLNTVEKSEPEYVGAKTLTVVVQETNDNVVGYYDTGNNIMFAIAIVLGIFFGMITFGIFLSDRKGGAEI